MDQTCNIIFVNHMTRGVWKFGDQNTSENTLVQESEPAGQKMKMCGGKSVLNDAIMTDRGSFTPRNCALHSTVVPNSGTYPRKIRGERKINMKDRI